MGREPEMKLLMLRHGKTVWNLQKKLQGRADIPLDDTGVDQVREWRLPSGIRNWYVSPLLRARQTGELLGITDYSVCEELIEMDWGDWEGSTIPGLRIADPAGLQFQERRGLDMQPPSGETPRQVKQRFGRFLSNLNTDFPVGVISHKGIIQAALAMAFGDEHYAEPEVRVRDNFAYEFSWAEKVLVYNGEVSLL